MNITVENLGPCKKLIRVDVPQERVQSTWDQVAGNIQRQVKLPGFRPGKAPKHMVLRSYSGKIEENVKRDLINEGYRSALKDHEIHVVGAPEIEEIQSGKDLPFQFAITVETAPDFELPDYKGLTVKKEMRTVTPEDVDQALEVLRQRNSSFNDVDRPAQEGDYVVVDYTATCEDKPITEWAPHATSLEKRAQFWMLIKEGQFIPGFTEQLVGVKAGEARRVEVTFPEAFAVTEIAGKTGVFDVTVSVIKEQSLPEIDDTFASNFGAEDVASLRAGVSEDLENELKLKIQKDVRHQLMQGLLDQIHCELPESVVEQETRSVVYNLVHENQRRGVSKDVIEKQKDEIYTVAAKSAKERVKSMFILGRIATKEGIHASNEEITHRIHHLAGLYEMAPEKLAKQLVDRDGIGEIREQIITSKVLDLLELHAKVEEVLPTTPSADPVT